MRIWDLNPGYLNRQSLLGEHRELHGIVSIITNHKKGYAQHPETMRWAGYGWAIRQRHNLLVAEMRLRGYKHHSPVRTRSNHGKWPDRYIDPPSGQMEILARKYSNKKSGRIPLPKNSQQLWAQHKYSILARDPALYERLGNRVARPGSSEAFAELTNTLSERMKQCPTPGGLRNALQHMWGHVSEVSCARHSSDWSLHRLFTETQRAASECKEEYLLASTALSELEAWIPSGEKRRRLS